MAEIAKWRKYANLIKAKRTSNINAKKTAKSDAGQKNGGASDVSILDRKEITVQPLATEATGKAKQVLKSSSNSCTKRLLFLIL